MECEDLELTKSICNEELLHDLRMCRTQGGGNGRAGYERVYPRLRISRPMTGIARDETYSTYGDEYKASK